jgi:hypothetical protein
VWSEAQTQSEKVFGPGFSFRKNHVFGNQESDKIQVNLRTVWKEIEEDDTVHGPGRVHQTWQKVLLNKRKRRRIIGIAVLVILAFVTIVTTSTRVAKSNAKTRAAGSGPGGTVTFYVTSDVPYDQAEEDRLMKDMTNLPGDAEFMVHLGNIQDSAVSFCPSSRPSDVASILKKSPVPVFMLPGAEDWAKCPNPDQSLSDWRDAFVDFDKNFNHGFRVFRDQNSPENISILQNGVLFLGFNLVNGPVHDQDAWADREMKMLNFYFGMTNMNKGQFRAIVLLGNARPTPQQEDFFNTVFTSLKPIGKPMAYIHANSGGGIREYLPFDGQKSVYGIEIEDGGKNPPLKVTVGFGDRPFLVG